MVGYNTNPPTLALMALATTQVGVVLALQPAANRWLRRTGPWTAVVASNAVILTVFLWHMTAAAVAAVVLFPTGDMGQPPIDSAAWLLWRVPWIASCTVVLAVLVALFARIELLRSVLPSCRARAVARRRDRARPGRRAGRAVRRCRVRPRRPRPHRPPMGCRGLVPVRCRCAARGPHPTCSVGCTSMIAADQAAKCRSSAGQVPGPAR
jgi:hypothetical protein